jgi:hypothetical protein
MALDFHRRAEELMALADRLYRAGDDDRAREAYGAAAAAEQKALEQLPSERERTRAVIAISAVSLYLRANEFDPGIELAHRLLGNGLGSGAAAFELYALLDDLRANRTVARQGLRTTSDQFEWILRGPAVDGGVAPLGTIAAKIGQIEKLGIRVYEYLLNLPLRKSGPPEPDVDRGILLLIGTPVAGSFRFNFRFATEPMQLTTWGAHTGPTPEQIAAEFDRVVDAAKDPDSGMRLEDVVPQEDYRNAFLKLVRNIVPDGKEIREIELRNVQTNRSVARLTTTTGREISRVLRAKRPPATHETQTFSDTLRALDLDEGWIRLGREGEGPKITIPPDLAIEDIIGPLVNHRVEVTAHRHGKQWIAEDVEPEGAEVGSQTQS